MFKGRALPQSSRASLVLQPFGGPRIGMSHGRGRHFVSKAVSDDDYEVKSSSDADLNRSSSASDTSNKSIPNSKLKAAQDEVKPVEINAKVASNNENSDTSDQSESASNRADVYEAWPLIRERYTKKGLVIAPNVMAQFYEACAADKSSPLTPYVFSKLVTVKQVGERHFASNCDRLVKSFLARDHYEMCIAFIRDVEMANTGDILLSYETSESSLIAAKWHKDTEMAMQAMQILVEAYSNVYARTWGMFLQLCLNTGYFAGLKWVHKHALVPGSLVIDDASYLRSAGIAAQNGDSHLCEWASLRMRRRQRALGTKHNLEDSSKLYVCLIEAAAQSSINRAKPTPIDDDAPPNTEEPSKEDFAVSFQTVCRYSIKLGPLANKVNIADLPRTAQASLSDESRYATLAEIFDEITLDQNSAEPSAASLPHAHESVHTLLFNSLSQCSLQRSDSESARSLAFEARDRFVKFNEDSILNFIDMARGGGSDQKTLEESAIQCPTPKVMRRVRNIGRFVHTD